MNVTHRNAILIALVLVMNALVYFFNIIRFPLFNNSFDPWFHHDITAKALASNSIAIDVYYGFPGLHLLLGYIATATAWDLAAIVRWFPLVAGVLASLVSIAFLRQLFRIVKVTGLATGTAWQDRQVELEFAAFGTLLGCSISVFSLVSSGTLWGQVLTASIVPLTLLKLVEVNRGGGNRAMFEFMLLVLFVFYFHHLTAIFVVLFIALAQLLLLVQGRGSLRGLLTTFVLVVLFLIKYAAVNVSIGVISTLTYGDANFFYLYFLVVIAFAFVLSILAKVRKAILARAMPGVRHGTVAVKIAAIVAFTIGLGIYMLVQVMPAITAPLEGLSPSWFLFYGSNLLLLAPLAVAGVLALGRYLGKTPAKTVINSWFLTIVLVLLVLFVVGFAGISVDNLEFGRFSTFIYPMLAVYASFSLPWLSGSPLARAPGRAKPGSRPGSRLLSRLACLSRVLRGPATARVARASIIAGFCILSPFAILGFTPPPSATLTQYWNTPSEYSTVSWMRAHAPNGTLAIVDYHLVAMARAIGRRENVTLHVQASFSLSSLQCIVNQTCSPAVNGSSLILVDKVMLESSVSYSGQGIEHGTLPPLGYAFLDACNNATFLNKVLSSGSQWLYCYRS